MPVKSDDRGVTLPEVLIAIAILAIIIGPLADALIGFVRNTDATTRRMNESHDIQLATTYFARDIQNLGVRDVNLTLQPSISFDHPCSSEPVVLSLAYDDPTTASGPPTVIHVTYLVRDVNGEHQLRRLQCGGLSTRDDVVVHNLVDILGPPLCDGSPCTPTGAAPQQVSLTVRIKDPANSIPTTVTLTGQRGQT
jgi:prepilin-type N-terminal cleavage/methylation domain-containing protein